MSLIAATPADAAAMAAAHAESFEESWSAHDIAAVLAGPGAFGFMVRAAGAAVAAFALARVAADEAELLTLAVTPDARRRGAGAALVEAVAGAASAAGAGRLFLEVAADNEAALALYRGAGFTLVGQRAA
ncbi:MAG TPA: GNAT family N-acetyltransferase, partial [Caulobacteraceae bacterium]|nr:GNAT family N-acetyltransferase [Caulobacteraceae bacterium]